MKNKYTRNGDKDASNYENIVNNQKERFFQHLQES